MATGTRQVLADDRTAGLPFPAVTAVAQGDLLWWDVVNLVAKPAALRPDQGSLVSNQRDFVLTFLGVSSDQRIASETSTGKDAERLVILDGIFDFPCTSQAWEVGDLIGVDRNAAVPGNYSQQVNKVTGFPQLAIGLCTTRTRGLNVATVRGRLISRLLYADLYAANRMASLGTGVTNLADANPVLTVAIAGNLTQAPSAGRTVTLPPESLCAGWELNFANLSTNGSSTTFAGSAVAVRGNNVVPANKNACLWCDGVAWYGTVSA